MRVFLPLVALVAGAHALTKPLARRESLDVCAYVDAGLSVPNPLTGKPLVIGHLDLCLCISLIPSFIQTNPIGIAAAALVGVANTKAALNALVTTAPGGQHCVYPDHATPVCTKGNPCGFTCSGGFTPFPSQKPTDCVCSAPKHECHGVCSSTPCPSSVPRKRSEDEWIKRSVCDAGFTACGVYGAIKKGSKRAYECVDSDSDLESCGGCAIALHDKSPLGIDCTSLPGVSDVSCRSGSCVVHRCMPGYTLSFDQSTCVDVAAWEKVLMAADFGLEHIPLGSY